MQYSVDIATEIYVLEIISPRPPLPPILRLRTPGDADQIAVKESGPKPPSDYFYKPTYPTGLKDWNKQLKLNFVRPLLDMVFLLICVV
ncbi:hypothetical protein Zmor_010228 [Zophobas morio]|uniref:Uncharacterized protein n=1 Tax=Zophobas morio TaxID=2755281 RepID=A0AA38MJL4_9CUCU|nr:hypothetical protein Zmor_010228 [Zophobas morio]